MWKPVTHTWWDAKINQLFHSQTLKWRTTSQTSTFWIKLLQLCFLTRQAAKYCIHTHRLSHSLKLLLLLWLNNTEKVHKIEEGWFVNAEICKQTNLAQRLCLTSGSFEQCVKATSCPQVTATPWDHCIACGHTHLERRPDGEDKPTSCPLTLSTVWLVVSVHFPPRQRVKHRWT